MQAMRRGADGRSVGPACHRVLRHVPASKTDLRQGSPGARRALRIDRLRPGRRERHDPLKSMWRDAGDSHEPGPCRPGHGVRCHRVTRTGNGFWIPWIGKNSLVIEIGPVNMWTSGTMFHNLNSDRHLQNQPHVEHLSIVVPQCPRPYSLKTTVPAGPRESVCGQPHTPQQSSASDTKSTRAHHHGPVDNL